MSPLIEINTASAFHDFSVKLHECPETIRSYVVSMVSSRYVAASDLFVAHIAEFKAFKEYLDSVKFYERDASEEIMERIIQWNQTSDLNFRMKKGEYNGDIRPEYLSAVRTKLYKDQMAGVRFLSSRSRSLLADSMGIGKCVISTTRIPTSIGVLEIQELFKRFKRGEEFKVLSESGMKCVTKVCNDGVKPTVKIRTSKGIEMIVGINHQFRILTPQFKIEWRRASKLQEGDKLLQVGTPIEGGVDNFDLAYFVGILSGDGGVSPRRSLGLQRLVNIVINKWDFQNEPEFVRIIEDNFIKHCGKINKWIKNKSVWRMGVVCMFGDWLVSQRLIDLTTRLPSGRHPKRIPYFVFESNICTRVNYLAGYVDTDGHVSAKANTIEISTSSIGMRDDLVALCTSIGLRIRITDNFIGEIAPSKKNLYSGKRYRADHTYHRVTIYSAHSFKLLKSFGFKLKLGYKCNEFETILRKSKTGSNVRTCIPYSMKALRIVENKLRSQGVKTSSNTTRNLFAAGRIAAAKSVTLETLNKIEKLWPGVFKNTTFEYIVHGQCYVSSVVSVICREDLVYDLSVKDDPTYVFNGYISHNTLESISTFSIWKSLHVAEKALVLTISDVKAGWAKEIAKHSNFTMTVLPNGTQAILAAIESYKQNPTDFLIVHYEGICQLSKSKIISPAEIEIGNSEVIQSLLGCSIDVVLADEAHLLKNMTTCRYKSFNYLLSRLQPSCDQVEVEMLTENGEKISRIMSSSATFHMDIGDEVDVL